MSDLGNKEVMAYNIKKYMRINKVTSTDVCTTLHIKAPTFSDWINAKTYPRIDKIEMLANYFGINKSDLVEKDSLSSSKGIRIPVLGRVIAGIPIEAIEEIIDYEEISEQMARTGEFFALQIQGDSMEPQMSEGDVVIVRKQEDIDSGQIGIILVNGDEATVKKVVKKEHGIMLIPFNSDNYDPWFYDEFDIQFKPVKIIGRVVECRKKY